MEYFRQGRSQAIHKKTLENRITGLNRRVDRMNHRIDTTAQPRENIQRRRRVGRINTIVDKLLDQVAEIEDAQDAGIFILPTGQRVENLPGLTHNLLTHLPISPDQAVSIEELAYQRFEREIDRGVVRREDAERETQYRLGEAQKNLQDAGWQIRNDSEGKTNEDGAPVEARYYLYSEEYANSLWIPKRLRPVREESEPEEEGFSTEASDENEQDTEVQLEGSQSEVVIIPHATLEQNRLHALSRMDRYVNSPREQEYLKDHQQDVMVATRDHFASGKSSGAIVMITGAGKTFVAGELAREIGLPTIMFAPTEDIYKQNGNTLTRLCRGMTVTNYSGRKKDMSGDVVNTLYQSVPSMVRQGVDLSRFGLVIYDEADLSLGEQRHRMHQLFPNAIKIALTATLTTDQLDGYKERGLIKGDEEWLETFTTIIHEVTEEEAFLRGAIPPQEFILVGTGINVDSIPLGVSGDVNPNKIARQLSVTSRDALMVAMITGLQNLPKGFEIPEEKRAEAERYHERIQGKPTLIHGFGVEYAKEKAKQLNELGIRAKAFYGTMKENRADVIEEVKNGETQVLIADQLAGRGLDIPELEVAFYMVPTLSARDLIQRRGRLYRPSPETGKTAGIHIQFVDKYNVNHSHQPILLTSLFEPGFVLRGLSKGRERERKGITRERGTSSPITIEGSIDLNSYFEAVQLQDLISKKFEGVSLEVINQTVVDLYNGIILRSHPDIALADVYSELADMLPNRNKKDVNDKILSSISSENPRTRALAVQTLMLTNIKSILTGTQPYMTQDSEFDNKLLQEVCSSMSEYAPRFHDRFNIATQIISYSRQVAVRVVAQENNVPVGWVRSGVYKGIITEINGVFEKFPEGLDEGKIDEFAAYLAKKYERQVSTVKRFLIGRNNALLPVDSNSEDITVETKKEEIDKILASLPSVQRRVIELRFFEGMTLEAAGRELGITRESVRQREAKALRALRNPSRSRFLRWLLD